MQKKRIIQKVLSWLLVIAAILGMWFLFSSREIERSGDPFGERDTESARMYQDEPVNLSIDNDEFAPMGSDQAGANGSPEETEKDTETEAQNQDAPQTEPETQTVPETQSAPDMPLESEPQMQGTLFVPSQEEIMIDNTTTPSSKNPENVSNNGSGTDTSGPVNENTSGGEADQAPSQPDSVTSGNLSDLLPPADIPNGNDGVGDTIRETSQVYFTTNIINGSTISTRELDVVITHKVSDLTPLTTTVELNSTPIQFNGHLLLEEGQNTIRITVVYGDVEGHQIEVSKTYTVFVELEKVIITTDLSDRTINQRSFSFTAYASASSQRVPLTVTVNGSPLSSSGNRYQTTLEEGDNEIILYASTDESWAQVSAHVFVDLPDQMQIMTDLYDHEVDNPNFSFYADLAGGTNNAALTVVCNGVTLEGSNGTYHCTLSRGNNFIRLKASDVDNAEYTMEFVVSYHNYIVKESWEADETMPKIITNVSDGMTLSSNIYSLQVRGEDGTGQRMYGDHLTVELNGVTLEDRSEDGYTTYYQLELTGGLNSLLITVWDYEDRYTIYRYSINCEEVAEGERIGSITVSVEATTVGLGYLIPPTTVDIYQGQNLVFPVATLLEACGYQYQYSGSLENGFYLAHIIKDGITNGYHIPEDLEDAINQDGLMWTNEYYTNSLGEFDFTQGSGWMYTLNGNSMPCMSDVYPADGDVVRLRYTLAYGRDIGLGIGSDGNNYNYSNEW